MHSYSLQSFLRDAKTHHTIPLSTGFYSDTLTPVRIFQSLDEEAAFLLESNEDGHERSRFSFIGLKPFMEIRENTGTFQVEELETGHIVQMPSFKDAFDYVQNKLIVKTPGINASFSGGGVGYMTYEAVADFEKIPFPVTDPHPRYRFIFCTDLITFDHKTREVTVVHFARLNGNETREELIDAYKQAEKEVGALLDKLRNPPVMNESVLLQDHFRVTAGHVESNYEKHGFMADVKKIKDHIIKGDIFQAVLSQRFKRKVTAAGFDIYRVLRMLNPSPYLFYLRIGGREVIGSSPERLVGIENGMIEINPIAGTRRRTGDPDRDDLLAKELLADEKELAEHMMLVDLARNDAGRTAKYGSVNVPLLAEIGRFSHVMHIVSKVTGELRSDVHPLDALAAAFPAGTVSGAPKVKAMEILCGLEPTARGIYSGGIIYAGFDGNVDSCIAIRTMVVKDGEASVQAGAGIVADSDPEKEYMETIHKASALLEALDIAEELFGNNEKGEELIAEKRA
ncbi:anthranilate synthase component I [Bacillus marinisedimentorum]|uniref:anthranilate synthase component I n=1 Tax=Bacillus marinisedimentorum TaxID=1821260 RepID=UPI0007E01604|nr:anthranilate synthase component I [Bacillus marinisedimentorum]